MSFFFFLGVFLYFTLLFIPKAVYFPLFTGFFIVNGRVLGAGSVGAGV